VGLRGICNSDLETFDSWTLDMYIVFVQRERMGWDGMGLDTSEETIDKRVYGPLCSNTTPQHSATYIHAYKQTSENT
jgi:hypothetical protein